jgi:cytochrome c553
MGMLSPKRASLVVLGMALVASGAVHRAMGGWAVVKVAAVPDAWIAGKPLELQWVVRQHGVTPLDDLKPTLEARSGSRRVTGTTWAYDEHGTRGYRGRIVLPERGDWQVTIASGFGRSSAVLVPFAVVDSLTPVRGTVRAHLASGGFAGLSDAERGRRTFAAQGCVTCHAHRDVGITGELADFGPELTGRHLPPEYLARFLADPSIKPPTDGRRMPDPGLSKRDIALLVAFLNAESRQASR